MTSRMIATARAGSEQLISNARTASCSFLIAGEAAAAAVGTHVFARSTVCVYVVSNRSGVLARV